MKNIIYGVLGMCLGGAIIFADLVSNPQVCRGVVLRDLKESAAYTQALANVMPDNGSDFVKTLTKGK